MPLDLSHTIHSNYLEAQIQGSRTPNSELEETAQVWSDIFKLSEKYDQHKILAHVRVKGRFPVNAQIEFSFLLKEIGCTVEHRIAAVAYSNEIFKNATLIEKYMKGEGYMVGLFKSKERAKRWLLHEKKKSSFLDLFDSFK